MLESIIDLGEICSSKGNFLDSLIQNIPLVNKKNEARKLNVIKFDTINNKVSIYENVEEIGMNTTKKYNYVGNNRANSPKWYCVSTTYKYFFMDTIQELSKRKFSDDLNEKIKYIQNNFFEKITIHLKNGKAKEIFSIKKTFFDMNKIKDSNLLNELEYEKFIDEYVKQNNDSSDIGLYVLYIDDICVCQTKEYVDMLISEKKGKNSNENSAKTQKEIKTCFNCGSKENIVDNIKFTIKYYIQDKVSFSSNYNKNNFYKNFALCQDCYSKMLSGESYLNQNLKIKFLNFDTYILPHFILNKDINIDELDIASENLKKSLKIGEKIKDIDAFNKEVDDLVEDSLNQNYCLINMIFFDYNPTTQTTKIKSVIKDINISTFKDLNLNIRKTNIRYLNYSNFNFDLNSIYFILPSYKTSTSSVSAFKKQVLTIISAIFTKKHLSEKIIIENGLKRIKQLALGSDKSNDKANNKKNITENILSLNKWLYFLKLQGCLNKGDDKMGIKLNINNPEIEEYILKSDMDEEKTGLFLLGCLISKIASSQNERGKPILNKLNYSGMENKKILALSDIVFEKLRQEKILGYNEILYSECMRLLNVPDKQLSKKANLFYILTGYAIMTNISIKKAQKNKEEKELLENNEGGNENE